MYATATHLYKYVKTWYTMTDEKISSYHFVPRHVHRGFWWFDDVEGPKRRSGEP